DCDQPCSSAPRSRLPRSARSVPVACPSFDAFDITALIGFLLSGGRLGVRLPTSGAFRFRFTGEFTRGTHEKRQVCRPVTSRPVPTVAQSAFTWAGAQAPGTRRRDARQ